MIKVVCDLCSKEEVYTNKNDSVSDYGSYYRRDIGTTEYDDRVDICSQCRIKIRSKVSKEDKNALGQ